MTHFYLSRYFPMPKPANPELFLRGLQDEEAELRTRINGRGRRRGAVIEHLLPWHGNYKCRAAVAASHPLTTMQMAALMNTSVNDNDRSWIYATPSTPA